MRGTESSLGGSVEASSKAFDLSLNNLQIEQNNYIVLSVKATIKNLMIYVFSIDVITKVKSWRIMLLSKKNGKEAW